MYTVYICIYTFEINMCVIYGCMGEVPNISLQNVKFAYPLLGTETSGDFFYFTPPPPPPLLDHLLFPK